MINGRTVVVVALASVLALAGAGLASASVSRSRAGTSPADVATLLARYRVPGASLAIVRSGQLVQSVGVGLADQAAGRPVDARTSFDIGSVSKTVTAATVLSLVAAGRVGLDQPVAPDLHRWHLPPPRGRQPTARDLLSHRGGLSVSGYTGTTGRVPSIADSLAGRTSTSPGVVVLHRTGTYHYSGGGYGVLQLLVEDVTGTPFPAYAAEHVLAPAGMADSSYDPAGSPSATPYQRDGRPIAVRRFAEVGPEGLRTTAPDLARFLAELMAGGGGVLPRALAHQMLTPAPGTTGADGLSRSSHYGLGAFVSTATGRSSIVWHPGVSPGWAAMYAAVPDRGDAVVILTNADTGIHVAATVTCRWAAAEGAATPAFCRVLDTGGRALFAASGAAAAALAVIAGSFVVGPSGWRRRRSRRRVAWLAAALVAAAAWATFWNTDLVPKAIWQDAIDPGWLLPAPFQELTLLVAGLGVAVVVLRPPTAAGRPLRGAGLIALGAGLGVLWTTRLITAAIGMDAVIPMHALSSLVDVGVLAVAAVLVAAGLSCLRPRSARAKMVVRTRSGS